MGSNGSDFKIKQPIVEKDYAENISASESWTILESDSSAVLIDVRTPAEWSNIGRPDLSSISKTPTFVSWLVEPDMAINSKFAEEVEGAGVTDKNAPIFFLCKSGKRSQDAACFMTKLGYKRCFNISNGFEGSASSDDNSTDGWKATNLPWERS